MTRERRLSILTLAIAIGCGGQSLLEPQPHDGGPDSTSSDADGGSSGLAAGSSSGAATSGGSASGSSGGLVGVDAGSLDGAATDGGLADATALDAQVPDAFPESCDGWAPLVIRADAAPNTCAFRPQDVWCDASTECVPYTLVRCSCFDSVYGVNKENTVRCPPPPCPPPQPPGCTTGGLVTQDCNIVTGSQQVAAACVDHQCMTYATGP